MRKRIAPIFASALIMFTCLFFACEDNNSNQDIKMLNIAKSIIYENPDSALIYLKRIQNPQKLNKSNLMKYHVALIQAKHKTYQDISKDSIIFEVAKYLNAHSNNKKEIANANLYAANVLIENKKYPEALKYLLTANSLVKESEDPRLTALINGNIGFTFYAENQQDSAISRYRKAFNIYSNIKDEKHNLMAIIYQIGLSFGIKQKLDSAIYYNQEGLKIAQETNDFEFEKTFLTNLASNYRYNKMPKESKNMFLSILNNGKNIDIPIYINLSRAYNDINMTDSALHYAKIAELILSKQKLDNDDFLYQTVSLNKLLSTLYEKKGNQKEAFKHFKIYNKSQIDVKNNTNSNNLIEIEKKYNLAEKEKELVKSKLHQQILLSISLATILMLVIAALLIIVTRNKHKQASQRNALLHKQIESTLYVNDLYKYITNESVTFEKQLDTLAHNYSVKEKSAGYETIQRMLKSMKKQTQENLSDSSLKFLKEQSVNIKIINIIESNTSDLLLVSLTLCHYEFKDIASLLGITTNALHMRRQRLKEKLKNAGISDSEIQKTLK